MLPSVSFLLTGDTATCFALALDFVALSLVLSF